MPEKKQDADSNDAHLHSITHREEILTCNICGCYYCLEPFPPAEMVLRKI